MTVPEVKGVGTTWVDRGAPYWARRAAAAVLSLAVVLFAGLITVGLARAIVTPMPLGWALLTLAGIAAVVGWSFWRGWRALVREDVTRPSADRRGGRQESGTMRTGVRLVVLIGNALTGAVLVLSAPFCVGWAAAWFLSCLRRYYPGEAQARATLAARPVR